jgi:acyl carrier protein/NAD(P)-dependent dehydrogenase (short-subunit alcohol dehydrogenase family)
VRSGARHLILTALHALPPEDEWESGAARHEPHVRERIAAVRSLQAQGADVAVVRADGSSTADMDVLFDAISAAGRSLRGVLHLAGVAENQALADVRFERDRRILAPKLAGAWLLHERTRDLPLDFFVAFSSISAVWGSRGQSLYAAANQFLNALAGYRRTLGLPALTVSWGPWSQGGMVDAASLDLLDRMGVARLDPDAATRILGNALAAGTRDPIVARIDWPVFTQLFEVRRRRPFLQHLAPASQGVSAASTALRQSLAALSTAEWQARVTDHVRTLVAEVLGWQSAEPPDVRKGLFEMGMDSLTALELKNRVQASLGVPLGGTTLFNYPSIAALTGYLATLIGPPAEPKTSDSPDFLADIDDLSALSEDELARLLDEQLGAVDSASE